MTTRVLGPTGVAELTSTTADPVTGRPLPIADAKAYDPYLGIANRTTKAVRSSAAIAVPQAIVLQQTTYYKLRGWDALVRTFETWVSLDAESAAPSGHTLVGREISAKWAV